MRRNEKKSKERGREIERERLRKKEKETKKWGLEHGGRGRKRGTERIAGYNGHDITIGITRAEK